MGCTEMSVAIGVDPIGVRFPAPSTSKTTGSATGAGMDTVPLNVPGLGSIG